MAAWTFARVRGIPLKVHWSLLLVLPLFAYIMARLYYPHEWLSLAGLAWGGALAVMLFVSILLHEFSHSFVAQSRGLEVRSILLFPLGGVSHMESSPERPRDEYMITIVGPITNYVIAAPLLALLLLGALSPLPLAAQEFVRWTAWLNVAIGSFNLFLPAFPLDGGRLLRSALATRMGTRRATHAAALVGKGLAVAMGVFGFLTFAAGGWWLMLIAAFIYLGASAEESSTTAHTLLLDLKARDLMTRDPVSLDPRDTLEKVEETMLRTRHTSFPVLDGDRLVGCIGLEELAAVGRHRLREVRVREVMQKEPPQAPLDRSAEKLMQMLQAGDHGHVLVMEHSQLQGVVCRHDLERVIGILNALGEERPPEAMKQQG